MCWAKAVLIYMGPRFEDLFTATERRQNCVFGFWSPSGLMIRLARLKVVLGSTNWIASNSRLAFCSAGYYSRHPNGENI
jgi:hypothetical protein